MLQALYVLFEQEHYSAADVEHLSLLYFHAQAPDLRPHLQALQETLGSQFWEEVHHFLGIKAVALRSAIPLLGQPPSAWQHVFPLVRMAEAMVHFHLLHHGSISDKALVLGPLESALLMVQAALAPSHSELWLLHAIRRVLELIELIKASNAPPPHSPNSAIWELPADVLQLKAKRGRKDFREIWMQLPKTLEEERRPPHGTAIAPLVVTPSSRAFSRPGQAQVHATIGSLLERSRALLPVSLDPFHTKAYANYAALHFAVNALISTAGRDNALSRKLAGKMEAIHLRIEAWHVDPTHLDVAELVYEALREEDQHATVIDKWAAFLASEPSLQSLPHCIELLVAPP